jgi:hypothetical protein
MCTMCSSQGNVIMGNAEADKRQENAWRRTCKLNGEGDNNMRMRFKEEPMTRAACMLTRANTRRMGLGQCMQGHEASRTPDRGVHGRMGV